MNYSREPQRFLSGTEIWSLQQGAGAGDGLKRLPDADLEPGPGSLGSNGWSHQTKTASSAQSIRQCKSVEKKTGTQSL